MLPRSNLTSDPQQPDYQHPVLRSHLPALNQVHDCWTSLAGVVEQYLPQEPREPDAAYRGRLQRAVFVDLFRSDLAAKAGLLTDFTLSELPPTLVQFHTDVDRRGTNLTQFLLEADQLTLRDGGCWILVEAPSQGTPRSRPYLVLLPRERVINWRTMLDADGEAIALAVIREDRLVPEGPFGTAATTYYRVLTPGRWQLWSQPTGIGAPVLADEGRTSLPVVPLLWYSHSGGPVGEAEVTSLPLSDLCLQHFRLRSDLHELLHKCAMPVPVRKGIPLLDGQTPPPLVIGPNSVVDVPTDGGFFFAEPSGSSLNRQMEAIAQVEALIDRSSLRFLSGDKQVTATEAELQGSQVRSLLLGLARQKESMFEALVALWCRYTGEASGAVLRVNPRLLEISPPAEAIAQYINLFRSGLLSRAATLEALCRAGWLANDFDIEAELALPVSPAQEPRMDGNA